MTTKLTGVANEPNADGSHDVLIDHEGERIIVNIPLHHLQELIGYIPILLMSDASLHKMKHEIDRALSFRGGSSS